ncbi:ATP-binding protein [Nocardiopsis gilva]
MHNITGRPVPGCPGMCRHEADHQLTFAGRPASVGVLRDWVARHLRLGRHDYPARLTDDLVICASEMGTNAIRHSRSGLPGGVFTASMWQGPGCVCLEVRDMGPRPDTPSVPHISDSMSADFTCESGRGLGFVAALCDGRCGFTVPPNPRGHTVWCELRTPLA